jgi:hypothetical protein
MKKETQAEERLEQLYCLVSCHRKLCFDDEWAVRSMLESPTYWCSYYDNRAALQWAYSRKAASITDGREDGLIPTRVIKRISSYDERKITSVKKDPKERVVGYLLYESIYASPQGDSLIKCSTLEELLKRLKDVSEYKGFFHKGLFQALAVIDLTQEVRK